MVATDGVGGVGLLLFAGGLGERVAELPVSANGGLSSD